MLKNLSVKLRYFFLIFVLFLISFIVFKQAEYFSGAGKNIIIEDLTSFPVSQEKIIDPGITFDIKDREILSSFSGKSFSKNEHIKALLASDTKEIAFIKDRTEGFGSEPLLYIYNTDTNKVIRNIKLDNDSTLKFPSKWSNDKNIIVINQSAQSVGFIEAYIYNIQTGKKLRSLDLYQHHTAFVNNDQLLYLKTLSNCSDISYPCAVAGIEVMIYNISGDFVSKIGEILSENGSTPLVTAINIGDIEIEIVYELNSPITNIVDGKPVVEVITKKTYFKIQ